MLYLPFRFVFVIFQSIFHFAPEIMLCRLQVLPYRLPIIDTLLQLPYPALFLTNITVANPYLLSYNLTSSIVFLQVPLQNIILSKYFVLTPNIFITDHFFTRVLLFTFA